MNPIVKDPFQRRIEIFNWIFLAIVFIPSLIFSPIKFSLGVLLGGFISIVNFYWMDRSLRNAFEKSTSNIKVQVVGKYFLRLTITAIVLYFLIAYKTVNVIGLLIGLSVVIINIVAIGITHLTKNNFLKEVK